MSTNVLYNIKTLEEKAITMYGYITEANWKKKKQIKQWIAADSNINRRYSTAESAVRIHRILQDPEASRSSRHYLLDLTEVLARHTSEH